MYFPSHHKYAVKAIVLTGGFTYMSYLILKNLWGVYMRQKYTQRRLRRQRTKAEAKEKFSEYLRKNPMPEAKIKSIVELPFVELVGRLKRKEITPNEALLAYQHKAFEVDKRCNCVVDFLYPNFSEINLEGPLAGAPVSIKDSYTTKGNECCIGLTSMLTGPADHDADMVLVIKSLGGVPFARTTVPPAMLNTFSKNPIDGCTLNPVALDRSPGGSSSGEAALIGGGGSPFGFGSDLGGSIRYPAAMCGIVGFKPSPHRISLLGMTGLGRFTLTKSCSGFLGRDVESIIEVAKAVWNSPLHHQLDYFIPPLLYSEDIPHSRPLRIGYFIYDGSFTPVPATVRAVLHVKQKLEGAGHTVIPWQPPFTGAECLENFLKSLFVDRGIPIANALDYDLVEPSMAWGTWFYRSSWLTRSLFYFYCTYFGHPELNHINRAISYANDIPSFIKFNHELEDFRHTFYKSLRKANVDAVILPASGLAAPVSIECNRSNTGMLTYLTMFNVTNMPSGTLPSGIHVTEADVAPLKDPKAENAYPTHSLWHKSARDTQLDSVGFQVSVQVVAAPWRDEMCLYVMREIEKLVKQ